MQYLEFLTLWIPSRFVLGKSFSFGSMSFSQALSKGADLEDFKKKKRNNVNLLLNT